MPGRNLLSRLARTSILLALLGLIAAPALLSAGADLRRADANLAAGNYAEAAADYEHAARLLSWRADLLERAGRAAYAGGDLEETIRLLEEAPVLSAEGWADLGNAYFKSNRIEESIRAFQRGIELRGPNAALYRGLVLAYNAQADLENETSALANYLSLAPEDAPARYRFGLLLTLSDSDRALEELQATAQLDPAYDPAFQTMRTALNLASLESDEARRLIVTGRGLGLVQEWSLAREIFQRATSADPKNAEAWAWLGEAKQHLGQDGREELERAEALDPFNANVRALFGLYWKRKDEPKRALAEFQWTAIIEPGNPNWHAALGDAYASVGDLPPALQSYQRAVELAPGDPAFLRLLAIFCAQYNYQVNEAGIPAAQKLITLLPNEASSFDLLGWLNFSAGFPFTAEVNLAEALRLDPGYAPAHLHLGMLYLQLERWGEARAHFAQAQSLDPDGEVGAMARRLLAQYFP